MSPLGRSGFVTIFTFQDGGSTIENLVNRNIEPSERRKERRPPMFKDSFAVDDFLEKVNNSASEVLDSRSAKIYETINLQRSNSPELSYVFDALLHIWCVKRFKRQMYERYSGICSQEFCLETKTVL